MQGLGDQGIGFSRRNSAADYNFDGVLTGGIRGTAVPRVWHDGIDDYFEGKASVVLLCLNGKWIRLQGMD